MKSDFLVFIIVILLSGCAMSLPKERHPTHSFPEQSVFIEEPSGKFQGRAYEVLGWVRSKAHFPTLEQDPNSPWICRNYFNKAAAELLREAKKAKGDAVIKVRSVVFLLDGKTEEYPTPECSDDGAEGEILLRGIAIRWKPRPRSSE